jgi:hypothetical protein
MTDLCYGLRDNVLLHISQVESGLACGCVCPGCSGRLVARKGRRRDHHFAHYSAQPCQHAGESALHRAAKEILENAGKIRLPAVRIDFKSHRDPYELAPASTYCIDSVRLEQRAGDLIPDVIATLGGRQLLIEVFVTHRVDALKRARLCKLGCSALEIDVSQAPRDLPRDELTKLIVDETANKRWINNARRESVRRELLARCHRKPLIYRGLALQVDDCPLPAREWYGKPYANVRDDCANCEHCLEIGSDDLLCNGHLDGPLVLSSAPSPK